MSFTSLLLKGLKKGFWIWSEEFNELEFVYVIPEKRQRKEIETKPRHAINGLTFAALQVNLTFRTKVSERELIQFRRFLRKKNENRIDSVVTIQDIKLVAIFLCRQKLPGLFHKFYNLYQVNQLLRACIVYIQFYLQTCEYLLKVQHLFKAKPVDPNKTTTFQTMKEDLEDLRVLIGRFYAGIIFGELGINAVDYISRTDEILLFEYFLRVSSIVVWIALERKYLSIIKVELGRIFRTANFNHFDQESSGLLSKINKEDYNVLIGKIGGINPRVEKKPDPLRSTSPIIHNFLAMDEPKLIMIGREDFEILKDDRLRFLTKYIFEPETKIQEEGVIIGILGYHRRLFDPLLYPCAKRTLKLLITGSPMDVSMDRERLREAAAIISQREGEPKKLHVFDYLPKIPRPNQWTSETEIALNENKEEYVSDERDSEAENHFGDGQD